MEKVAHSSFIKTSKNGRIDKFKVQTSTLLFALIIFLAAFLRLYRIQDYMTFLGDEGRDVLVVYKILHGQPTLLGPTASVGGFFLGPIYYYFITPFLWFFNYNPVGPAIMVGLFGIATVFLVYKIGSEFFNKGVGLIAAFLYSISPLAIAYSRSSWNPNLMPFFSLLVLYVLYKAINKNKNRLFILCGVLLGITMQLHYLATFLGVIIATYTFLARLHLKGVALTKTALQICKEYLYVFLGFFIGWSPFLAFEVRHDFPNIQSIISFIFSSGDAGSNNHFFSTIFNVFFRLFARLVTNFPPPEQVSLNVYKSIALWYYLTLALALASLLLLAYKFIKSFYNKEQFPKISLLALWLLIGVGLFGFYKKPIYDYYFGFMFPLPFLLVGLTISSLYTNAHAFASYIVNLLSKSLANRGRHELTRIGTTGKILSIGIFAALIWINVRGAPFRYPANRQLAQVEEISRFVLDKSEGKQFNFALIAGGNSDHAYRYFFTLWDRAPVTIENPQKDPKRKTVADQLLVVCETSPCAPLGNSLWEIAGFGRAEIINEWSVSVVKVYKLRHYKGKI